MNIEIQKNLLPELQKIVWKKVFRGCMIDLKENTKFVKRYMNSWNWKVEPHMSAYLKTVLPHYHEKINNVGGEWKMSVYRVN